MICFGIANAIAAALAGPLNKIIGRKFVMLGVYVLHICIIVWMIFWRAVEKDYITYCTIAALWGLADGIWLVEVNGITQNYLYIIKIVVSPNLKSGDSMRHSKTSMKRISNSNNFIETSLT